MKPVHVFIFLICSSAYAQIGHSVATKGSLKQAKTWFEKQNCRQVISYLKEKDFTKNLENESEYIDRYYMLGVCYFQLGEKKNAEIEFNELLFIRPDYELDPFITPPPLIALFNELKSRNKAKSKELAAAKEKAIDKLQIAEKKNAPPIRSIIPALIPFGIGQFENGQKTKGIILATAQASMLSANIGFYWWKRSFHNTQGTSATLEQYNLAQTLQFVAFGAFLTLYIYGVTDAILNREVELKENSVSSTIDITTQAFLKEFREAKSQL